MARKLYGILHTVGMQGPRGPQGPQGPPGPGGGVESWNSRQGEVVPEYGDYTMQMVGAELLTNTELDEIWRNF